MGNAAALGYLIYQKMCLKRTDRDTDVERGKKGRKSGEKKQKKIVKKIPTEKPLTRKYERAKYEDDDVIYDNVAGWRITESSVPVDSTSKSTQEGESKPKFLYESVLENVKKKKERKRKKLDSPGLSSTGPEEEAKTPGEEKDEKEEANKTEDQSSPLSPVAPSVSSPPLSPSLPPPSPLSPPQPPPSPLLPPQPSPLHLPNETEIKDPVTTDVQSNSVDVEAEKPPEVE